MRGEKKYLVYVGRLAAILRHIHFLGDTLKTNFCSLVAAKNNIPLKKHRVYAGRF